MPSDIKIKKGKEKRVRSGHLWLFSNEIGDSFKKYRAGDIIDIYSHNGEFMGRGYINPFSLISARILTHKKEDIDTKFFYNRIMDAWMYRKKLYPDTKSCRVVFGESDFMPGLIVDKYENYLTVQTLSLGMDIRMNMILNAVEDIFHPDAIIERNDVAVRKLEGLEERKGILKGKLEDNVVISDDKFKFEVDVLNGQKTGFFFDQRENRHIIKKYAGKGDKVLDCFCYSGAWSIYAAGNGAGEVIGLDSSADAIKLANENAIINKFSEKCRFKRVDIFEELRRLVLTGEKFDIIILDPPAFVKSSSRIKEAVKGYKEINLQAMKLLRDNGILITCSCSYHIDRETFKDMLIQSASDSEKDFRILEFRGQAPDHPVLLSMKETEYLKCAVLQGI